MNERVIQFRVGVVVVAATIITGILIMLFGEGKTLMRDQYTIYLLFPRAPGVTVDTPVRKHGVLIGRVSQVELRDEGGVRLTARIDRKRSIYGNEVCLIKPSSLLGDAVLEFVISDGEPAARGQPVPDDATLADGIVASNPLDVLTNLEGTMASAIVSIESAANDVEVLAESLNRALGDDDDQLSNIMRKAERALDQFTVTMESINTIVDDEEMQQNLRRSLADLPNVLDDIGQTLGAARETFAEFNEAAVGVNRNMENLENLTRPLGERGDQLAADIGVTFENLSLITEELSDFSRSLNSPDGSLGRLINDQELYDQVTEAVRNVNYATRRIRPILDDVRVFTDKIARDPRQLGVKGALDRRPSNVGLK